MKSARADALRLILPLLSRLATVDFFGTDDFRALVDVRLGFDVVVPDRVNDDRDRPPFWATTVNGRRSMAAASATPMRLSISNLLSTRPKFSTRPNERITLFGQMLVGGSRVRETADISGVQVSGPYSNGFIFHPSGGLDIALARWVGLRVEPGYNFHRIEGENSNGFQIAIGPVFRFAPR